MTASTAPAALSPVFALSALPSALPSARPSEPLFTLLSTTCALALLSLLMLPGRAHALGPSAPFKPPGAASIESDVAPDRVGATAAASSAATATSGLQGLQGLQGLRLGHRPMALIDGQWWAPGSGPHGARLVSVTRHGAWLRHRDGRSEFLALLTSATHSGGTAAGSRTPASASAPPGTPRLATPPRRPEPSATP